MQLDLTIDTEDLRQQASKTLTGRFLPFTRITSTSRRR